MSYEQMNNNRVFLKGKVVEEPVFSHESHGEAFYETMLEVSRLSDVKDRIPITISEKLMAGCLENGKEVTLKGQFRSYNKIIDDKSKLVLFMFVREKCEPKDDMNSNIVELNGFICKRPIFRKTPFNREICDFLIAVNRSYNKSDYLPCIAWGRSARYIKEAKVGDKISLIGRIQSREYQKTLANGEKVDRVAYEISVTRVTMDNEKDLDAEKNNDSVEVVS